MSKQISQNSDKQEHTTHAITTNNLTRTFGSRSNPVYALNDVTVNVEEGEFCVIVGRSGSGKSTLLNQLCGLDQPSDGSLKIFGVDLAKLNKKGLASYRSTIGIIFQSYNLLPNLNTLDNVAVGSWAGGGNLDRARAKELLDKFGLGHRLKASVNTLSGGEKQRVAICRALISDPDIVFCDEPTGALDTESEDQVMKIIQDLNRVEGKTIVMVTHNPEFEAMATQVIRMEDGKVVKNEVKNTSKTTSKTKTSKKKAAPKKAKTAKSKSKSK